MSDDNNKKGMNTLYAVIGVATLVVAIIGATFAYFSAAAKATGDEITGGTNNTIGGALSLEVERVKLDDSEGPSTVNDGLVPANIQVTENGIGGAIDAKCISEGYTGCHLYKITAQSTQTVESANLRLTSITVDGAQDTDSWKYVIYKSDNGEEGTISSIVNAGGTSFKTFADTYASPMEGAAGYDMHQGAGLTENTPVYYYLLIYLANKENNIQNPEEPDEHDGAGSYKGSVTLDVLGGKVIASFAAD